MKPSNICDLLLMDAEVLCGHFTYPCRLRITPRGKYLSVQLHGAVDRSNTVLPFARWNWGHILGAHVLSICDPTIYLNGDLRIGWYLGTEEESAIEGVIAIAEECARIVGIDRRGIIYTGSSGGGFAALQAAALAKDGKAIAINAQTDLLVYNPAVLGAYVQSITNLSSVEEAKAIFGSRLNAILALQ